MPRQKRPSKHKKDAKDRRDQAPAHTAWPEYERPRVQFSADGMIEEAPASAWGRAHQADLTDSRTLAELAASVISAQQLGAAGANEDVPLEPEPFAELAEAAPPTRVKVTIGEPMPQPDVRRSLGRRGTGAFVLLLVVLAALGVAWLRSAVDSDAPGSPGEGELVAAPVDGGAPLDGSIPPADAPPPPEAGAVPVIVPTPEPAAAPAPPPPPAPAPTLAPAPVQPPPPPPPPPPMTAHIGDLDGAPKGGKLFVEIWVHDAAHNPVAGATVNIAWQGATGPASCVTGVAGSCTAHTNNLSSPATATLTVTGVSVGGGTYDAAANHDPDGDSSGTSITVTF